MQAMLARHPPPLALLCIQELSPMGGQLYVPVAEYVARSTPAGNNSMPQSLLGAMLSDDDRRLHGAWAAKPWRALLQSYGM